MKNILLVFDDVNFSEGAHHPICVVNQKKYKLYQPYKGRFEMCLAHTPTDTVNIYFIIDDGPSSAGCYLENPSKVADGIKKSICFPHDYPGEKSSKELTQIIS